MDKLAIANIISTSLSRFNPEIVNAESSVYVKLTGSKFRQVRISDHNGRKTSAKCIEIRKDAMTDRKTGIFNIKDIGLMIKLIK